MFKLMLINIFTIIYARFYTERLIKNVDHTETRNIGDLYTSFFFCMIQGKCHNHRHLFSKMSEDGMLVLLRNKNGVKYCNDLAGKKKKNPRFSVLTTHTQLVISAIPDIPDLLGTVFKRIHTSINYEFIHPLTMSRML